MLILATLSELSDVNQLISYPTSLSLLPSAHLENYLVSITSVITCFLFHWFQFIHHFLIHTHTPSTIPLWPNSSYSNLLPISCTTWSDCSFLACSLERMKPQRWLLGQMYERRFIFQEIAAKKPRHIHPTIPNWKWATLTFSYLNFRELEAWYEMKTYWILFPPPPSPQCLNITFAIFPIWNVFLPPLRSCPSSTYNLCI